MPKDNLHTQPKTTLPKDNLDKPTQTNQDARETVYTRTNNRTKSHSLPFGMYLPSLETMGEKRTKRKNSQ
jgi:hypothetical protein